MTSGAFSTAQLRQVSAQATEPPIVYRLSAPMAVLIGRDPRCQIVLDSRLYSGVSRQHAQLYPDATSVSGWQICDLGSANGTYLNEHRVQQCLPLYPGDRIRLAQDGPEFVLELIELLPVVAQPQDQPDVDRQPASLHQVSANFEHSPPAEAVTFSQLFPILSTGRDLTRKAYLIPGVITVSSVVLMFLAIGRSSLFNLLIAVYIAGIAYYFVYQLCGKRKPWWVLLGSGLTTLLILLSPLLQLFLYVFRGLLPGDITDLHSASFGTLLIRTFFGAGLMEELLKAIPVLLAYWLGTRLRSPQREQVGVWEPLDGLLLGTASAVGFTLLETLSQYVPNIISDVTLQAGQGMGELVGLQLLIPRILGSISGHMAYSGYLGYFIGLSVLKPKQRWRILGVGYFTSATLHTLWNATGAINLLVLAVVGVISYAFLTAAILKARALSPNRSQNFATRLTRLR